MKATLVMHKFKDTKNTGVYNSDDPDAPIKVMYIQKDSGFDLETLHVTLED